MNLFQWILGGLAFAAEIALWLGSGRIVYLLLKDRGHALALVAGILTVVAFVALWSLFLAPKADHRLGGCAPGDPHRPDVPGHRSGPLCPGDENPGPGAGHCRHGDPGAGAAAGGT